MSLISASLGAASGIGEFLFDGTWKELACAASAWASGVNAQSYHFIALSMLGAPLMMLMEPTSKPVPSHGDTTTIGTPDVTAGVTRSCWNEMPINVSPRDADCAGAAPDLVYWLMFSLTFLR